MNDETKDSGKSNDNVNTPILSSKDINKLLQPQLTRWLP